MPGMIVAPQPVAVEEGAEVLRRGGNAIDAAITTAFVQGVVDPQMCGIGGFGTMLIYLSKTGETTSIDFHARAGSLVTQEIWADKVTGVARDGFGYILKNHENDVGYTSVAVPGTVLGLYEALTRFGTISWKDAIVPAVWIAREGFVVGEGLARYWRAKGDMGRVDPLDRLKTTEASAKLYLKKKGTPYEAGDTIKNPDLAEVLERLAEEGPDWFYTGDISQRMTDDILMNGGFITADDLRNYRVRIGQPLVGEYRGLRVLSNLPPGGGITLIEMLQILDGYDLGRMEHNGIEYVDLISRGMRVAATDRAEYVGDPEFVDVPIGDILSHNQTAMWRKRIDAGIIPAPKPIGLPQEEHTTHISTIDRYGNAIALTHTLGASSGVITPGLGFQYNNAMIAFDPIPGGANAIAPGKARISGMVPTLIFKDGTPHIIIGAPGGTRIMTGVLQVLLNVIDFRMSMVEAVYQPRFDAQGEILFAQARIPMRTLETLKQRGYFVEQSPKAYGGFALVHGIRVSNGRIEGGADPGGDGMVVLVP